MNRQLRQPSAIKAVGFGTNVTKPCESMTFSSHGFEKATILKMPKNSQARKLQYLGLFEQLFSTTSDLAVNVLLALF